MLTFLLITGFVVGILTGMLGIGGGILITPILLYVPTWIGIPALTMKSITGLTMVQGLVGSASGYLAHRRHRLIHTRLIYWMGPVIVAASFMGAHLSGRISDTVLMVVFAVMALLAAILMFIERKEKPLIGDVADIHFSRPIAITGAAVIGFSGGLVGQGGSFLLIPALINILGIPTKVALGTNLGIVLLSSLAGLGGKISSSLVEPWPALALMIGVIPGAQLGGVLSHRLRDSILKKILALVIGLTSVQIWWTVLKPVFTAFFLSLSGDLVLLYSISALGLIIGIINTCLLGFIISKYIRNTLQKGESDKKVI